ncbi:hypothetical protein SGPA1_80063 [Streptomyces misionensis JCM 4497]
MQRKGHGRDPRHQRRPGLQRLRGPDRPRSVRAELHRARLQLGRHQPDRRHQAAHHQRGHRPHPPRRQHARHPDPCPRRLKGHPP